MDANFQGLMVAAGREPGRTTYFADCTINGCGGRVRIEETGDWTGYGECSLCGYSEGGHPGKGGFDAQDAD